MKRTVLLFIAAISAVCSFAQHTTRTQAHTVNVTGNYVRHTASGARTTAAGDTLKLSNIADTASLTAYKYVADSGYTTGTNGFGDMGFAERYDFNPADSSIKVVGVMSRFTGKVNPASAHSVNFHVWSAGVQTPLTATLAYSGFPDVAIDTLTVPFTQLGIGPSSDTLKAFFFDSATVAFNESFFVGYDMNYTFSTLAGDTIGLVTSLNGDRTSPAYFANMYVNDLGDTARDTIMNVQNCTQWSDYTWHDNYTDNDGLFNDLAIFPIVAIGTPTSVAGITHNNLTFFGNYPNPAVNATNIRFSLLHAAGVTIQIMDVTGRILQTISEPDRQSGEHIIAVNTSQLAPGNYIYAVRLSTGEAIASTLTVIR